MPAHPTPTQSSIPPCVSCFLQGSWIPPTPHSNVHKHTHTHTRHSHCLVLYSGQRWWCNIINQNGGFSSGAFILTISAEILSHHAYSEFVFEMTVCLLSPGFGLPECCGNLVWWILCPDYLKMFAVQITKLYFSNLLLHLMLHHLKHYQWQWLTFHFYFFISLQRAANTCVKKRATVSLQWGTMEGTWKHAFFDSYEH